jgi:Domain of unknown function (DUF4389)
MSALSASYPASLDVDPAAPQGRLGVFFRIILVIPQAIVLYILGLIAGIITFIAWIAIVITGKYPGGMMSFVQGTLRWGVRVGGYMYLLTDKYPPFAMAEDDTYPVRAHVQGQTDGRNRLTVFFRIIMLIPHAIILGVLGYAIGVVVFIAWVIALVTGSIPGGLHTFISGYLRWYLRYATYALLLTDEYPPFSLS